MLPWHHERVLIRYKSSLVFFINNWQDKFAKFFAKAAFELGTIMMPKQFLAVTLSAATITVSQGYAQSISPTDLLAAVDAQAQDLSAYHEILADPDPSRAVAAMQIMLGSGDPVLERMALEAGLFSSNPTIRMLAVSSYMDTSPSLSVHIDGSGLDEIQRSYFAEHLNALGGTVSANAIGFISVSIGEAIGRCWDVDDEGACGAWLNDTTLSFEYQSLTANGVLSDQGTLVGNAAIQGVTGPLIATIKIVD